MTFDYAETAALAAELLSEFGATGTLTRSTPGEYDADEGEMATTPTTQPVTACMFPYGDRYTDGANILATDRQAFISALGVTMEPRAGDVLTWGGEAYSVVKVKNLAPARVNVLFECQVRSG